jgi:hypothetical protein
VYQTLVRLSVAKFEPYRIRGGTTMDQIASTPETIVLSPVVQTALCAYHQVCSHMNYIPSSPVIQVGEITKTDWQDFSGSHGNNYQYRTLTAMVTFANDDGMDTEIQMQGFEYADGRGTENWFVLEIVVHDPTAPIRFTYGPTIPAPFISGYPKLRELTDHRHAKPFRPYDH